MHNFPQFKRQLFRRMTKRHGGKKCHEVGVSDEALIPKLLSIRSDNTFLFSCSGVVLVGYKSHQLYNKLS